MAPPERTDVLSALNAVIDPVSGKGLADAGLVQGLILREGRAGFMLEVRPDLVETYAEVRAQAEAVLAKMPGVERAQVVLTADLEPAKAPPQRTSLDVPSMGPPPGSTRVTRGARISPEAQSQLHPRRPPPTAVRPAHIRHVVAVASGKGGVGKSTVAVNLACALSALGLKTGLLDADVCGPSVPRMTGLDAEPQIGADKKLQPLEGWGLKVMSIGLIVDEGAPMIWRGPMASQALNQMVVDVAWGTEADPLDVLVVDLPPGTGDIQLSLVQKVVLDGVVVVSTPQEVALIDARRAVAMFEKTGVEILGVVENMAFFADPATGQPIPIFGRGGARETAQTLGKPFLGEVPIEMALRQSCDDGKPLVATQPDSAAAKAFVEIARAVAERLEPGRG